MTLLQLKKWLDEGTSTSEILFTPPTFCSPFMNPLYHVISTFIADFWLDAVKNRHVALGLRQNLL